MTVLVTGGAGYIGSHMVLALVERGEEVVVLDNLATGRRALVPGGVRLVEGDVADRPLVSDLLRRDGISEVIHFAGSTVVPESVSDPLKYYRNNVAGSLALLEETVAAGVDRLIFSSTAAVYAASDERLDEDAPLGPVSPYGRSKLMTERMIADTVATGALRAGVLRYFNVAGADPEGRTGQSTPQATHLIKVACEALCGRRDGITIFGTDFDTPDGTGVRDYIHVSDLVAAHLRVREHLSAGGGSVTFNCGYGRGNSVREVLRAVERVGGERLPIRQGPRRPGDPARSVASADRLRRRLGWQPRFDDLDTIVAHALAWERRLAAEAGARSVAG